MPIVQPFTIENKLSNASNAIKGEWVLPRSCHQCAGRMYIHMYYSRKYTYHGATPSQEIRVPLMRCHKCGQTIAILPHFLAPYQRMVTAVRESVIQAWTENTSLHRLATQIGLSLSTIRRWVGKAKVNAPKVIAALLQLCYEFRPDLPAPTETLPIQVDARLLVALTLKTMDLWQALVFSSKQPLAVSNWEAVNLTGPLKYRYSNSADKVCTQMLWC